LKGVFTSLNFLNFLNKYNNMRAGAREDGLLFFLFGLLKSEEGGQKEPPAPVSTHIAKPLQALTNPQ